MTQALRQADELGRKRGQEESTIHFVLIPSDTSRPLQELAITYDPVANGGGGDLLLEHLKPKFREKSDEVDLNLMDPSQQQTLSSVDVSVSQTTLQSVAREGHVETFSLVHPTPENGFASYQLYLDEIGMLKRLPLNTRAAEYARRAGYDPPPTFYGDVYLGKTVRRAGSSTIRSASLRLSDAAMDAPWLSSAATTNLQYQLERNKLQGRSDVQPGADGADGNAKQEDEYSWTQTEEEIEIRLVLPSDEDRATAKKNVKAHFRQQSFEILYHQKPLLILVLFERVDVDSCTWTLESKQAGDQNANVLVLSMEKVEPAYWPRIRD